MVCFVVTQHSESRVSHSVFATPKHLADRQLKIESLTKILDQNALEYLASGKGFILDRLRLDILTRILNNIFNYNLFRVIRVIRG